MKYILQNNHINDQNFPNHNNQDTIQNLVSRIESLSILRFTDQVFKNKQRTSTKSGILKTEAFLKFAKCLFKYGIYSFKDIDKLYNSQIIENNIKKIPGQNSGISYKYFLMLSGNQNFIKPDRIIIRYIEEIVETKLNEDLIIKIIKEASAVLIKEFQNINPRSLDHKIWKYQSEHTNLSSNKII